MVKLTHDDKMSLVHAANLRRAAVQPTASNMKYVKWDDTLAASAAVHAKRCQFAHSTPDQLYHPVYRHQIGENLAVFRGPKSFVNDLFIWIVDGFYEERKYYDYESHVNFARRISTNMETSGISGPNSKLYKINTIQQ